MTGVTNRPSLDVADDCRLPKPPHLICCGVQIQPQDFVCQEATGSYPLTFAARHQETTCALFSAHATEQKVSHAGMIRLYPLTDRVGSAHNHIHALRIACA